MFPTLEAGPLSFPTWFTSLLLAFSAALTLAWWGAPRRGLERRDVLDVSLVALAAGLLGARALHVLADGHLVDYVNLCLDPGAVGGAPLPGGGACTTDAACASAGVGALCANGACHPARDCLRAFVPWAGGYVWYGGLLAAVPAALLFARHRRMPAWRTLDLLAAPAALGLGIGRVGCFLAGCCYGAPTSSSLGVAFPVGSPAWRHQLAAGLIPPGAPASLPVHPTQLYEATIALLLVALLWTRGSPPRREGEPVLLLMALYGIARICLETLRADERGLWFGSSVSTSQLIAAPIVVTALVLLRVRRSGGPSAP